MRQTVLFAAATAAALAALPAAAQQTGTGQARAPLAQAGQQAMAGGQFWVDPRTGCSYARAQVQGYAPTWHLIVNGARMGLTNARAGCPGVLRSGG